MLSRPQPSRRRLAVAVVVSIVLHAALLVLACLTRSPARAAAQGINTQVSLEGRQLGLIPWSKPLQVKGISEEEQFVRVEQTPAIPFRNDSDSGPIVIAKPGIAGVGQSGSHSAGEPGKGGKPSFFSVPLTARRIVFALDRSLSMGLNGALTRARAELLRCLHTLPVGCAFQVVLYNRAAETILEDTGKLLIVEPDTLQAVEQVLADTRPEDGTDHEKAFERALGLEPEVIFLVTDADDLTPAQIRHITSVNRQHVIIHTIDVSRRLKPARMLAELAHQNGGQHLRAP